MGRLIYFLPFTLALVGVASGRTVTFGSAFSDRFTTGRNSDQSGRKSLYGAGGRITQNSVREDTTDTPAIPNDLDATFGDIVDGAKGVFRSIDSIVAGAGAAGGGSSNASLQGNWTLATRGVSGVSAQQMAVVDDDHVIIFDKVEHNPIKTPNGYNAWGALYTLSTAEVRPLELTSNSFCAGGAFLGNGTMVSIGGDVARGDEAGPWFNNTDGRQSLRIFTPCPDSDDCQVYDNATVHSMIAPRWYPSTVRMLDGSIFIIGGSSAGGFINDAKINEPTYEYFPRKSDSLIRSQFLIDTLGANLFPIAFIIPSGDIFVAANTQAMLYNPTTNTERRLPDLPNGVRVSYPFAGSGLLLPLTPSNQYTPEVLICGGSTIDDSITPDRLNSQIPASKQCVRMVLTEAGIQGGWKVESMPQARHMHSMALLPSGQIVIVNGAQTGVSSYHSVQKQVGYSNADHPTLQPLLYDYTAAPDSRFSTTGMPTSPIARMYHSAATVTPNGDVMISGSNPNGDITTGTPYPTELSVEILSPPYTALPRPSISTLPAITDYDQSFTVEVTLPSSSSEPRIRANFVDPGFSTHGLQLNTRLVELVVENVVASGNGATVTVRGPPSPGIYPPGYAWLHIHADDVPSPGKRILVGDGSVPLAV